MLTVLPSVGEDNECTLIDLLYNLCKENDLEKVQQILPFVGSINIINKIQTSTGSTCLHVACYYGHRDMVKVLLDYGATHCIRNLRHNLTPYEEACTDEIKQLFIGQDNSACGNDYNYIEWSMVGDDLLGKRHEFRQAIDVYKTYDNHHLVSKLLAEVIHYYLNEYLVDRNNDLGNCEDKINRQQIASIEAYFKEAIERQDYLTYFIKAYTLTNFFYKVLNKDLALYVLEYFDKTKTFSSNYRLVNCLVHLVTLLIHHPNLPHYRYQGICYRGMRITQNDLDQYQLNRHILNRAFLSTSLDLQVAEMFAGEGQQSHMRYTPHDRCALQYSCICQYVIKQASTAIDIESLSTRPDEKEILIIPFSVFKITAIKRNYLENPNASIAIEIELEECEDPDAEKNELESSTFCASSSPETKLLLSLGSETSRSSRLSPSDGDIKDAEEYVKYKQRKALLYGIITFLVFAIIAALTLTFILVFVVKKHPSKVNADNGNSTLENDNIVEYQLPLDKGCPNILNRTSWNARPYTIREKFKTTPVTHIVIRQLPDWKSFTSQKECIQAIKDLQDFQMDKRGWADIGYNFLICNDNNGHQEIYRGRGWTFIAAHCIGYNLKSLGIAVMGNYTNTKSLDIFKSLIQCGIAMNVVQNNFTLVGDAYSRDVYEYYLNHLKTDTDLQFSNQGDSTQFYCS